MAPNASIWMLGRVQTVHWQEPHLYGFDLPCYRVNTFQDPVQMLNSCVVAMRLVDLVGLDVQRMLRLGNPQALPAKCCLQIILLLPKYNASKVSAIQINLWCQKWHGTLSRRQHPPKKSLVVSSFNQFLFSDTPSTKILSGSGWKEKIRGTMKNKATLTEWPRVDQTWARKCPMEEWQGSTCQGQGDVSHGDSPGR